MSVPSKIVYLFGAGATQAVVKAIDPEKGLLTAHIQGVIENDCSPVGIEDKVWNELTTTCDVEHLISVLESQYNYSTSEKLRKHYRDAIVKLANEFSNKPPHNLYSILIDLHRNIYALNEELSCFITLNYEDILERTIIDHFNCDVDYVFQPGKIRASSDFRMDEFKDASAITALCMALSEALNIPNIQSNTNTVEYLNEVLKVTNLYDKITTIKSSQSYTENIKSLKENYEITNSETDLKILNRYLLEEFYPQETPKSQIRGDSIKVLKLHGSFNWHNIRPIAVKDMASLESENTLWIPPGVEKKKENYPFNLLWGKAIEYLMTCDVLRVVGCSLSRNDWGLIPILYTVQQFNKNETNMEIQVIDYPEAIDTIKNTYKYLKVVGLFDLPEFLSFYKDQFPNAKNDSSVITEIKAKFSNNEKANPLQEWLDSKIDDLIKRKVVIDTPNKIVSNFYYRNV